MSGLCSRAEHLSGDALRFSRSSSSTMSVILMRTLGCDELRLYCFQKSRPNGDLEACNAAKYLAPFDALVVAGQGDSFELKADVSLRE